MKPVSMVTSKENPKPLLSLRAPWKSYDQLVAYNVSAYHRRKIENVTSLMLFPEHDLETIDQPSWLSTYKAVDRHTDDVGRILLYCSSGKGSLVLHEQNKCIYMQRHSCLIFNDCELHSWESETPNCNLLAIPFLKGTKNNPFFTKKNNPYYLGNFYIEC